MAAILVIPFGQQDMELKKQTKKTSETSFQLPSTIYLLYVVKLQELLLKWVPI